MRIVDKNQVHTRAAIYSFIDPDELIFQSRFSSIQFHNPIWNMLQIMSENDF